MSIFWIRLFKNKEIHLWKGKKLYILALRRFIRIEIYVVSGLHYQLIKRWGY
ncbi:hypothetical protein ES705_16588 [subsurface metagenome]